MLCLPYVNKCMTWWGSLKNYRHLYVWFSGRLHWGVWGIWNGDFFLNFGLSERGRGFQIPPCNIYFFCCYHEGNDQPADCEMVKKESLRGLWGEIKRVVKRMKTLFCDTDKHEERRGSEENITITMTEQVEFTTGWGIDYFNCLHTHTHTHTQIHTHKYTRELTYLQKTTLCETMEILFLDRSHIFMQIWWKKEM